MRPWLVALAACYAAGHAGTGDDAGPLDGPPSIGGGDASDGSTGKPVCASHLGVNACGQVSDMPRTITQDIDTDSTTLCAAVDTPQCVITGTSITIGSASGTFPTTVHAFGSRPLVIIADTTLVIAQNVTFDASSSIGAAGKRGPGANATEMDCAGAAPGVDGGGAGGSLSTLGGRGGDNTVDGTVGGVPASATPAPTSLRAGCPGQLLGATTTTPTSSLGGGAIYLVAGLSITNNGRIVADGAAGAGRLLGGDGGGAGGFVALDAPALPALTSIEVAGGGGGGGGNNTTSGGVGHDGNELGGSRSLGGAAATFGGSGGAGATSTAESGGSGNAAAATMCGGGGGGGGEGVVACAQAAPAGCVVIP